MKSWFEKENKRFWVREDGREMMLGEQETDDILKFLKTLEELEGVAPEYLVVSSSMLPPESLRFFYIDENWVNCMVDGALSIGGEESVEWGRKLRQEAGERKRTGFLLRSVLVKAFPGVMVTAKEKDRELEVERLAYMGDEVLLGIVKGDMDSLVFTEPEESLLCEFTYDKNGVLCAGEEPVTFREGDASGVVEWKKLAEDLEKGKEEFTAAEFGKLLVRDKSEYYLKRGEKTDG